MKILVMMKIKLKEEVKIIHIHIKENIELKRMKEETMLNKLESP